MLPESDIYTFAIILLLTISFPEEIISALPMIALPSNIAKQFDQIESSIPSRGPHFFERFLIKIVRYFHIQKLKRTRKGSLKILKITAACPELNKEQEFHNHSFEILKVLKEAQSYSAVRPVYNEMMNALYKENIKMAYEIEKNSRYAFYEEGGKQTSDVAVAVSTLSQKNTALHLYDH